METSPITISSEIPIELYDKLVLHAHDVGVNKDTIILNALRQYLKSNGDTYLFGDYEQPAPDYLASGKVEATPAAH
ncbi:hypothetical protein [Sporomusa aerivorans]|uniref:hypothetical protein n=1 Tax=Sporomusa aerivorans TaxID=204936 RepID=UPI00352ABF1B